MKTPILEARLELIEHWQENHQDAMTALDGEELLQEFMDVFEATLARHDRLEERSSSATEPSYREVETSTARILDRWLATSMVIERLVRLSGAANYTGSSVEFAALEAARERARGFLDCASIPPLSTEERRALRQVGEESEKAFHGLLGW